MTTTPAPVVQRVSLQVWPLEGVIRGVTTLRFNEEVAVGKLNSRVNINRIVVDGQESADWRLQQGGESPGELTEHPLHHHGRLLESISTSQLIIEQAGREVAIEYEVGESLGVQRYLQKGRDGIKVGSVLSLSFFVGIPRPGCFTR